MTMLDANLLLYAHNEDAPLHAPVKLWLTDLLQQSDPVGLPWLSLWAFLRISTNAQIWLEPLSIAGAWEIIRGYLAHPGMVTVHPGPRHARILEQLMVEQRISGPRVTDVTLAALAIEHGAVLASTDRDFSRFANLKWVNPAP